MEKPTSCIGCPLYAEKMVWGHGNTQSQLIIIGQNPGPDEVRNDPPMPFVGGSGRILNRALQQNGFYREQCFTTNVVKCYVPPGHPVPKGAVEKCRPLLEQELSLFPHVKTILTVGQEAFEGLTGKELYLVHHREHCEKNPRAWLRGSPYVHNNRVIIPTVHPAFVARSGFIWSPVFESVDIRRAVDFALGKRTILADVLLDNPTRGDIQEYVQTIIQQQEGGLDIETPESTVDEDDLDPLRPTEIECVGLSRRVGESILIKPNDFDLLEPLLGGDGKAERGSKRVSLWTYNGGSFDFHHLGKRLSLHNVRVADGMLAFHLLWSDVSNKDLATAETYLTDIPYYKNTRKLNPDFYNTIGNCRDTYGALQLGREAIKQLSNRGMEELFWRVCSLCLPLNQWRVRGSKIDTDNANRQMLTLSKMLEQYEAWWEKNIPHYSWSSPQQLVTLFTGWKKDGKEWVKIGNGLGMPLRKKKRTNNTTTPCIDEEVLEEYAEKHKCQTANLVVSMRKVRHAGDFFNIAGPDGFTHPRPKLHGQSQGRIQLVDPNLQTLPEELWGQYPRQIVVPDNPDGAILVIDYSQFEMWIYAWYTKCRNLLQIKESGNYIHGLMYEQIWNEPFFLPGKPKTKQYRDDDHTPPWKLLVAKSWPLGILYGRGIPDVTGLPITLQKSKQIFTQFHKDNFEIDPFHRDLLFTVEKQGYWQTVFKRMRRFPNAKGSRNEILSFPGQGTAVDILINNALRPLTTGVLAERFGPSSRILFSVHDSIVCNVHHRRYTMDMAAFCQQHMEAAVPEMDGFIPPTEPKAGPSWGAVMSLDKYYTKFLKESARETVA